MEHELPGVLDGADEPVSVEELEGVVRRAGQRRRARLVAGAAGLLMLGALGGALARGPGDAHPTGFAASREDAAQPAPLPQGAVAKGFGFDMGTGATLTPLFRRDAPGVAVRAYRAAWGDKAPPTCAPPDTIQAELSNAAAVTVAMAPQVSGDAFALLGSGTFGNQEGEPATWAIVRSGPGVETIRFRLGATTDTMAPKDGIAVLAAPGADDVGVVEGLGPDGSVVAAQKFSELTHPDFAIDPACMPTECLKPLDDSVPAPTVLPAPASPDEVNRAIDEQRQKGAITGVAGCEVMPPPPMSPPTTVEGGPTGPPYGPATTAPPASATSTTAAVRAGTTRTTAAP